MFRFISEISAPSGQDGQVCANRGLHLTIDLDWCHEAVLADTLELLEVYEARATVFCTDRTESLDLLKGNRLVELGVHPNFRPLLSGENAPDGESAARVLDRILSLVPTAKSVRSHSLTSSSDLSTLFRSRGLTHESNIKLPFEAAPHLAPFYHVSGMLMCPFQWGDHSDMEKGIPIQCVSNYLVVNFHPIHIFLNSNSLDQYERTRPYHYSPGNLRNLRTDGTGVRTHFLDLLEAMSGR